MSETQWLTQWLEVQYVSDLHLEFSACDIPILPDTDVLVLAGDIHSDLDEGAKFVHQLLQQDTAKSPRPGGNLLHIVVVLGNHECYKRTYPETVDTMRKLYSSPVFENRVHFLENDSVIVEKGTFKIKFIGSALWCDPPPEAHFMIQHTISDFERIHDWTLTKCQKQCRESIRYIESEILSHEASEKGEAVVVVVTHFCPSLKSIHEKYQIKPTDKLINRYFATPVKMKNERRLGLWIHGHTHASMDYVDDVLHSHVVCNPRGYSSAPNKHPENDKFCATTSMGINLNMFP